MTETTRATDPGDWVERLGLRVPVVCAPMGGVAGGRLASAVSLAGALGTIGMGSAGSAVSLERQLALLDDGIDVGGRGGAPFGIGMVGWGIERDPLMLERALAARPALISIGFVDWAAAAAQRSSEPVHDWIAGSHGIGALVATQAATAAEAAQAERCGVDLIVARGEEGGGHGDHRVPRDMLLQEVLAAVDVPVLAAGAVSDAADLAAVLRAGASGAWVGTAFSACEEALTSEQARSVLLAATGDETLVTRAYDVALERPWPIRFPERLLRTEFIDRWHGREHELAADIEARAEFRAALAAEDYSVVPIDAGSGVGSLTSVRSAAEVVASLAEARVG